MGVAATEIQIAEKIPTAAEYVLTCPQKISQSFLFWSQTPLAINPKFKKKQWILMQINNANESNNPHRLF